jgi:hypothetical protein
MTTYPLSEPARIFADASSAGATPTEVGRGTLEACVDIVAGLSEARQRSVAIHMDDLDLRFDAREIGELLHYLRTEKPGLSNAEITEIKVADQ